MAGSEKAGGSASFACYCKREFKWTWQANKSPVFVSKGSSPSTELARREAIESSFGATVGFAATTGLVATGGGGAAWVLGSWALRLIRVGVCAPATCGAEVRRVAGEPVRRCGVGDAVCSASAVDRFT